MQTTSRARIEQHAERAANDQAAAILAAGHVAHVGFCEDGQPVVIPMNYQYDAAEPNRLYVHGSPTSRVMQRLGSGEPICIAVTLLDGLVYSKDEQNHSVNYRSVVAFGKGRYVQATADKQRIFERMIARMFPGRTAGRDYAAAQTQELQTTAVVEVEIEEMSAKSRSGGPKGPRDGDAAAWGNCGVVQL